MEFELKTFRQFTEGLSDKDIIDTFREQYPEMNCSDKDIIDARKKIGPDGDNMGFSKFIGLLYDAVKNLENTSRQDVIQELTSCLKSNGISASDDDYDARFGVYKVNDGNNHIVDISFDKDKIDLIESSDFSAITDLFTRCQESVDMFLGNLNIEILNKHTIDEITYRFWCKADFNKSLNL